jgi:hypothetical protein
LVNVLALGYLRIHGFEWSEPLLPNSAFKTLTSIGRSFSLDLSIAARLGVEDSPFGPSNKLG